MLLIHFWTINIQSKQGFIYYLWGIWLPNNAKNSRIVLIDFFLLYSKLQGKRNQEHSYYNLEKIFKDFLLDTQTIIFISNAGIKNNVATSILYVYSGYNLLAKTIHYAINVTSTEVEFFTIRCSIN